MTSPDLAAPSPVDDLLRHQTAARKHRPAMADTAEGMFTERYWYMGTQAPAGNLVFGAGLGWYPNRGAMDGYAGVTVDSIQHAFHARRDSLGTGRLTPRSALSG